MARDMRRKNHYMKEEIKKLKVEAYECLAMEKEKLKHECQIRKIQISFAKSSRGDSRDMSMFPFLNWK